MASANGFPSIDTVNTIPEGKLIDFFRYDS